MFAAIRRASLADFSLLLVQLKQEGLCERFHGEHAGFITPVVVRPSNAVTVTIPSLATYSPGAERSRLAENIAAPRDAPGLGAHTFFEIPWRHSKKIAPGEVEPSQHGKGPRLAHDPAHPPVRPHSLSAPMFPRSEATDKKFAEGHPRVLLCLKRSLAATTGRFQWILAHMASVPVR
jgi:hypothetical protein